MGSSPMEKIGECNGVTLYFADSRFERPGVYYWDGADNVRAWPPEETAAQAELNELRAELARIEEHGTPWVPELLEWLEKHDCCPPLPFTDYELIESLEARFGTKPPAAWPLNPKPETGWTFDPAFLERAMKLAEQQESGEFAPSLEGVETVLLALQAIGAPNPPQPSASVEERASELFDAMLSAPYGDTTMGDIVCAETTRNRLESAWLPIIESALTTAAAGGGLRELVERWRAKAKHHEIKGDRTDQPSDTNEWHKGMDEGVSDCADELEAALGRGGNGNDR